MMDVLLQVMKQKLGIKMGAILRLKNNKKHNINVFSTNFVVWRFI